MEKEEKKNLWKKVKDVDAFGNQITLYYKGQEKSKTYFGSVFTILYSLIYLTFFTYEVVRMVKKKDVTFYDSQISPEDPPFIQLNKDNFYGAFALEDPVTYDPIIDDTIYTVKTYFKRAIRNGEAFNWEIEEIELERCKIEKFGELYRKKFSTKPLELYYCFKKADYLLEGTFSYDAYSLFYIQFFPCMNSTENNNHCKTKEEIDYYLKGTMFTIQMEDIELSPENFENPTRPIDQDIYTTVGKKLFKEFHIYLQIVNIETDLDVFGFEEIPNKKTEKFIKYDYQNAMTKFIENDIYQTGESFADVTIKLSDLTLIQKRKYVKLLDILGNVGGLMEVVLSLFNIISSFSSDLLFETSLVNSLFEFDLGLKQLFIYNRYKEKIKYRMSLKQEDLIVLNKFRTNPKLVSVDYQNKINEEINIPSTKRKIKSRAQINLINSPGGEDKLKNKRRRRRRSHITSVKISTENRFKTETNDNESDNKNVKTNINNEEFEKKVPVLNIEGSIDSANIVTSNLKDNNNVSNNKKITERSFNERRSINSGFVDKNRITKLKIGKFWIYVCFIWARRRKDTHTILLNEAMRIIRENLDIINVFRKIYRKQEVENREVIEMSEECKTQLNSLSNIEQNI